MTDATATVREHYSTAGLTERIIIRVNLQAEDHRPHDQSQAHRASSSAKPSVNSGYEAVARFNLFHARSFVDVLRLHDDNDPRKVVRETWIHPTVHPTAPEDY